MICAHRIRHWLKHRAQLPGAHPAHFQRCTRRVNQNIFDMHMTEIAALYRFIAIGEGLLMAPAIIARILQNFQRIFRIQLVDQLSGRII